MRCLRPLSGSLQLLCLAASLTGTSAAQVRTLGADLTPGARVRVTTNAHAPWAQGGRVVGSFVAVDGDSLRLAQLSGDTVALPLASVARVERSAGPKHNYGKGALIGGGIGLAIGATLGGLAESICGTADAPGECHGEGIAAGGLLGAAAGAGVAVLFAAVFKSERWHPVADVGPGRGMAIGLRARF